MATLAQPALLAAYLLRPTLVILQLLFVFIFGFAKPRAAGNCKVLHSTISFAADLFCAQLFAEHMSEHLRFMQVFFAAAATYSIFDVLVCECVFATLFMAS